MAIRQKILQLLKKIMSEDFVIGDLVWAKMKGYPPWPGKIVKFQPNSKPPPKNKKGHYVYFFGSDNFAWIPIDCISPHSEIMLNSLKKKKSGAFQNAIEALISHINEKKEKQSPSKIKRDTDPKKQPLTKVVRVLNNIPKKHERKVLKSPDEKLVKKRPRENDSNGNDYPQFKFAKIRESIEKIDRLLSVTCEFDDSEKFISLKYVEPKIGFIGLGNMGQAIVTNLLKSGHRVTIWNRSQSKCDAFVKLGAVKVNHASDVICECDITFCCVSDPEASKRITFEKHGILKGLEQSQNSGRAAKGYVEMTSIDPDTSLTIARAVIEKQGRYLEAPVCGTSKNAVDGSLLILASGDRKLFFDCLTCFSAMGKHSYFVSCDVGCGTMMSLLLSMVSGTVCAAVAEAMALAERLNIPHEEFLNILSNGPLNCKNIIEKCRMMADPNPPTLTPLKYIQKDLNLSLMMGDDTCQQMPVNAAANEVYKRGRLMKYSESDISAIFRTVKF